MTDAKHQADARRDANYCLAVLSFAYVLNFFDRSIINVLLDSIKADMHLSDTELGFIAGLGFVALYAILGIPFARLADATSRRAVVGAGIAIWSVATALGGLAQTGLQLALSRTGVGLGEAAGTAPSHALLSEHFDRAERARALSILNLGAPIGVFLGLFVGGWAAQHLGWRSALFIAGAPGLLVAFLVLFTVKPGPAGTKAKVEPLRQTVRFLLGQRSYVAAVTASFFAGFGINAVFVWTPAFFGRVHGMSAGEVGLTIGLIIGLTGVLGVYLGGEIVTHFVKRDERWRTRVPAIATLLAAPALVAMLFSPDRSVALALLATGGFFAQMILGPVFSIYQTAARPSMRSFAVSIHNLVGTLAGLGVGALAIGAASDYLQAEYGDQSLRYALIIPMAAFVPAGLLYFAAGRTVAEDVRRAEDAATASGDL